MLTGPSACDGWEIARAQQAVLWRRRGDCPVCRRRLMINTWRPAALQPPLISAAAGAV